MNKIICITGASSGIGKATAEVFAREKCRLILTARRREKLNLWAEQLIQKFGIEVLPLYFDVRNEQECAEAIGTLPDNWRNIDVLVNNAGLALGLDYIHEGNTSHWDTMIDTNIKGLLYMTRLISQIMVERGKGHIINVCSTAGKEVYPKGNVYCATKFAVNALTSAIRQDLLSFKIKVSQVAPGHVEDTEFALNRFGGDPVRAKIYQDFNPLKAADVAEAILFIATRPAHVNILDIVMTSSQQASANLIDRSGRIYD